MDNIYIPLFDKLTYTEICNNTIFENLFILRSIYRSYERDNAKNNWKHEISKIESGDDLPDVRDSDGNVVPKKRNKASIVRKIKQVLNMSIPNNDRFIFNQIMDEFKCKMSKSFGVDDV